MKRNDITDIKEKIFFQNYENLFNVYETDDGDYYYNITRKVNIPDDLSPQLFQLYIVVKGDTWTGLAHRFYGDVRLWWVICATNQIANPLSLPEAGQMLKVLGSDMVQPILSKIKDA